MLKLTIVLLNWNRIKETIQCLKSIDGLTTRSFLLETVVVDNNSSQPGINKLKTLFPKIHLILNSKNLGFAGGNNKGIKHALEKGCDSVLILNNDTVLDKDLVENLLLTQKATGAGVISPKIYFSPGYEFYKERYKASDRGKVIWFAGGKIDWQNAFGYHLGVNEVDHGQFDKQRSMDYATGAAMFVSKNVFEKIGLFDEKYFLYYEDLDFCLRAKKSAFKIYFSPKAFLYHHNAGSSFSGSSLQDYYISRNRLLFGLRYAPFLTKVALVRESLRILQKGRSWQKRGVEDYYLRKFHKGSYE